MTLSALLVDDEPPANERMRSLLAAVGGVEVVGVAGSVQEARGMLVARRPDVVFLDMEIPGDTGLGLLPSIPDDMQVVFVTAHETYALHAFAAGALDYLVKPVNIERLTETVRRLEKMARLLRSDGTPAAGSLDDDNADESSEPAEAAHLGVADVIHVSLPVKGQKAGVKVGDICWVEGLRNFTRVGLKDPGRIELFKQRLGEWSRRLPDHLFARLGKSFLLQVAAIKQLEFKSRDVTVVTFADDLEPLAIGRRAATRLREILANAIPGPESSEQ